MNVFLVSRVSARLSVTEDQAASLLQRRWRLPLRVRERRGGAPGAAPVAAATAAASPNRDVIMGYRYLYRSVSHFYQIVGVKAVAAFAETVHERLSIGTIRHLRGSVGKQVVVFSAYEARQLLATESFITELHYRDAVLRALTVMFSVLGVLQQCSEPGSTPGTNVLVCRLGHVAMVTMKIRQHLRTRCTTATEEDAEDESSPVMNAGHRAEWVQELLILRPLLLGQGARASNGLRISDGDDPFRADPTHRLLAVEDVLRPAGVSPRVDDASRLASFSIPFTTDDGGELDDGTS